MSSLAVRFTSLQQPHRHALPSHRDCALDYRPLTLVVVDREWSLLNFSASTQSCGRLRHAVADLGHHNSFGTREVSE